jgi:hypothetical protein
VLLIQSPTRVFCSQTAPRILKVPRWKGEYTLAAEAEELLLYFESLDEELVDIYSDQVIITQIPKETGD